MRSQSMSKNRQLVVGPTTSSCFTLSSSSVIPMSSDILTCKYKKMRLALSYNFFLIPQRKILLLQNLIKSLKRSSSSSSLSLPLFFISERRRRRTHCCFKEMLLSLYQQTTLLGSPFKGTQIKGRDSNPSFLSKSLFPLNRNGKVIGPVRPIIHASLIEAPVLWAGRVCIFYVLLKTGLAGSDANPLVSELRSGSDDDLGFSEWLQSFQGRSEEKEASDRRKLVSKWHPTTKGTLKRSYRVASKPIGKRLLRAIASLLSDDDHFLDATSHKGCQIRRESAHGESVCCNNVRALFDELPTPHLVLEITPFPAGSLTEKDYTKAEKLEKVLRTGASI